MICHLFINSKKTKTKNNSPKNQAVQSGLKWELGWKNWGRKIKSTMMLAIRGIFWPEFVFPTHIAWSNRMLADGFGFLGQLPEVQLLEATHWSLGIAGENPRLKEWVWGALCRMQEGYQKRMRNWNRDLSLSLLDLFLLIANILQEKERGKDQTHILWVPIKNNPPNPQRKAENNLTNSI